MATRILLRIARLFSPSSAETPARPKTHRTMHDFRDTYGVSITPLNLTGFVRLAGIDDVFEAIASSPVQKDTVIQVTGVRHGWQLSVKAIR